MADIKKLSIRYIMQGLCLVCIVAAGVYLVMLVMGVSRDITPIIVGAAFAVVIECADALIWRKVAENAADSLPTFYTAVSGFRMLLAIATMFVYYLVAGSGHILKFILVFFAFYEAILFHHSYFFSKVSNSLDKLKK
ncbi:hypothetical protein [Xylanibacter muris]|uniref:ATP synthase subunit I n=1 Tax=Xylanibacter muris TaxID=2736290 RepID=A0ABX2AMD0_9BACT|nr:hypothetical protein [Xylanibacter muris]NPD91407.1 hypothetical protein [Xylanibacter muris]